MAAGTAVEVPGWMMARHPWGADAHSIAMAMLEMHMGEHRVWAKAPRPLAFPIGSEPAIIILGHGPHTGTPSIPSVATGAARPPPPRPVHLPPPPPPLPVAEVRAADALWTARDSVRP